jgi:SAM-dependent methyltransferase
MPIWHVTAMTMIERLDRRWYPAHRAEWDAWRFRGMVLERLDERKVLLDIGAGRGAAEAMRFRGRAGRVVGIDIDPVVMENPFVDEAHVSSIARFDGVADGSIDVAIAKDVMEHVEKPRDFFAEVHRILKPGGIYLGKTPNRWHYVPLIAQATPFVFHRYYNRLRGREEVDTFPTFYRLNSPGAVRRAAESAGLVVESLVMEEGRPEYLRLSVPTYVVGFAYERLVNTLRLEAIKSVIYVTLRKPG